VPDNCPKAYGHTFLICHSDFQIDYIEKTINVNMYAEENTLTNEEHYRMDIFSSFDQSNEQITATLKYSCTVIDDCARTYAEGKAKILFNHQPILYAIKDNLYNLKSSNVQQCYDLENKTIDCINGLCRAELGSYLQPDDPFTPIPYYKTYCDYYPPDDPFQNKTGFMSTNTYGIPSEIGIFNTLHYVCNKNLCNNYGNIQFIQKLVDDFNKFDKPTSATTTISSGVTITMTLLLFMKYFFNY